MTNKNIKWGLIIQGHVVTYGHGPNNSETGFSSLNSVDTNIANFSPYVSKIIVSTWKNSGLYYKLNDLDKVELIESTPPPLFKDHDNSFKQFLSTYNGAKHLAKDANITHVLKIRTDQIVDPKIIEWLNYFFEKYNNLVSKEKLYKQGYLVFSDMMKDNLFYMGDFIFAGKSNDIVSFCKSNLKFKYKKIHPSTGKDYILKHLLLNSSLFWSFFYKYIPLLWQVSNNSNKAIQSYWTYVMKTKMAVIPSSFFWSIIWRDRLMSDVISDPDNNFHFYEDWKKIPPKQEKNLKLKSFRFLMPTIEVMQEVKYELILHWNKKIVHYRRKIKQYFVIK